MNDSDATNTRHDGEEPQAPPKLAAALKELPARRVFVPPAVDQAVLRAARRHLAGPERSGFERFRVWLGWPAVAAAGLALLVLIGVFATGPIGSRRSVAREDINGDGQVDVLDAFQLARDLPAGRQPAPDLDLNGDGAVDRRDVEALAARAVKLEKGGRS
jgi:hypothetical protein